MSCCGGARKQFKEEISRAKIAVENQEEYVISSETQKRNKEILESLYSQLKEETYFRNNKQDIIAERALKYYDWKNDPNWDLKFKRYEEMTPEEREIEKDISRRFKESRLKAIAEIQKERQIQEDKLKETKKNASRM